MSELRNLNAHSKRFESLRSGRDLRSAAFEMVGGGDYEMVGYTESLLLDQFAPIPEGGLLIDIGCGPGRLARYLKKRLNIRYLGTDIIKELLDVANMECDRDDWRFEHVSGFKIPVETGSADVIVIFSVFTNIYPEEAFLFIQESSRVLRKGGKLLISYFDIEVKRHRQIFLDLVINQNRRIDPLVFLDRQYLEFFATENNFNNVTFTPPDCIRLSPNPGDTLLDGRSITDDVTFGQMICVMEK